MATTASDLIRHVDGTRVPSPGTYEFDPGHTTVAFEGRHLVVTRVRGRFLDFSGALHVGERIQDSQAELVIQAASLASGLQARDDHLRSPDFLDVAHHPTITFRTSSIEHVEAQGWSALGELTIRGVTRSVAVAIEFAGGVVDPWGNEKIGFSAQAEFNREDFGLTWNMLLDGGGLVASKQIRVEIDVEAVRRPA